MKGESVVVDPIKKDTEKDGQNTQYGFEIDNKEQTTKVEIAGSLKSMETSQTETPKVDNEIAGQSISQLESKQVSKEGRKPFSMPSCCQVILLISAVAFFIISYWLANKKITQLVDQSISYGAFGFGIITIFVLAFGVVANRRKWRAGFYIEAVCLITLMLAEISIVCVCVLESDEKNGKG